MTDKNAKTMHETGAVASRRRAREGKAPVDKVPAAQPAAILDAQDARMLLAALTGLRQGDSSVRLPAEWTGMQGKLAETFNEVVELNERMA